MDERKQQKKTEAKWKTHLKASSLCSFIACQLIDKKWHFLEIRPVRRVISDWRSSKTALTGYIKVVGFQ